MAPYGHGYALFYDRYFTGWTQAFAPPLESYMASLDLPARSMVDLCCGTGEAARVFADAGWWVCGVDNSSAMLAIARGRLQAADPAGDVLFVEADARTFTLPVRVAAAISLDGALNHLESEQDLERCFRAVREVLLDGGQFVFDLYDAAHYRHWNGITVIDDDEAVVVKRGAWDDEASAGMVRISGAIADDGAMRRVSETFHGQAYERATIDDALARTGFTVAPFEMPGSDALGRGHRCGNHAGPCRTIYRAVRNS